MSYIGYILERFFDIDEDYSFLTRAENDQIHANIALINLYSNSSDRIRGGYAKNQELIDTLKAENSKIVNNGRTRLAAEKRSSRAQQTK